jgi:hypothetical protein
MSSGDGRRGRRLWPTTGVETERVRSRGWRRVSESKERAEIPARSTTTFTITVDDLTEALELSSDGFVSASRWQGPADE